MPCCKDCKFADKAPDADGKVRWRRDDAARCMKPVPWPPAGLPEPVRLLIARTMRSAHENTFPPQWVSATAGTTCETFEPKDTAK